MMIFKFLTAFELMRHGICSYYLCVAIILLNINKNSGTIALTKLYVFENVSFMPNGKTFPFLPFRGLVIGNVSRTATHLN